MKDSLDFYYNGYFSVDLGIKNVNVSGTLFEDYFLSNRNILEVDTKGNDRKNFMKVEKEPIEFQLEIAFDGKFDREKMKRVKRAFEVDYFKPFYFANYTDIIFYCMPVGDSMIYHNGSKEGYFTLTMRCDTHHAYSNIRVSPQYSFDGIKTDFTFNNEGDLILKPEMWIDTKSAGSIEIVNTDRNDEVFRLNNLNNEETIYINHEREHLETNIPNKYRMNDMEGKFMSFNVGRNRLKITGDCNIIFRYQLKIN